MYPRLLKSTVRFNSTLRTLPKAVFTKNAPAPVGPYSQAVHANGFLYVSGQLPLTPTGTLLTPANSTTEEQTSQILTNLSAILAEAHTSPEQVVKVNIFVKDIENDFAKINKVYGQYFAKGTLPARSVVEVAKLPLGASIELECVASVQE